MDNTFRRNGINVKNKNGYDSVKHVQPNVARLEGVSKIIPSLSVRWHVMSLEIMIAEWGGVVYSWLRKLSLKSQGFKQAPPYSVHELKQRIQEEVPIPMAMMHNAMCNLLIDKID